MAQYGEPNRPGKFGAGSSDVDPRCECGIEDDYADGRNDACECGRGDCRHYCRTHDIYHCPYDHDSRTSAAARDGRRCFRCRTRLSYDDHEHHYTDPDYRTIEYCDDCAAINYHESSDYYDVFTSDGRWVRRLRRMEG